MNTRSHFKKANKKPGTVFPFRRLVLAFLLLTFPAVLAARTTNDTYSIIVYKLYRDYAWQAVISLGFPEQFERELGTSIHLQPISVLKEYFDDSLSSLIAADSECMERTKEICALDADIIFNSQDPTASDLKITEQGDNIVLVQYTYPPSDLKVEIKYTTVWTDKGWRISDIVYFDGSEQYSLRKMLSSFQY